LDAQLVLRYLGLMRAKATGTYGRRTTASVRAFQRLHRLGQDGVLGPRTWPRLRRSALMKARLVRVRTARVGRRVLRLRVPRPPPAPPRRPRPRPPPPRPSRPTIRWRG